MSRPSIPPREVLAAHHQGRATLEAVVHSLIHYDGWFVPVTWMLALGRTEFKHMAVFGKKTMLAPGELWIFTDLEAASLAASTGALLGTYATGPTGIEVFRKLNDRWTWNVFVNPLSPTEATWALSREQAHLPTVWSDAFELEQAFEQSPNPDPDDRLKSLTVPEYIDASGRTLLPGTLTRILTFPWYLALIRKSDGVMVTFTDDSRIEVLPLFTGRDNVNAYLDRLYPTEQDREQIDLRIFSGARIFDTLMIHPFMGLLAINPFGPAASFLMDLRKLPAAP